MELNPKINVSNLLAATIDLSNRGRLQCEILKFDFEGNSLKFFNWIKDHVCCGKFLLAVSNRSINREKLFLDFFATGSDCASEVVATSHHLLKAVVVGLVQKFVDLKSCDESHIVHSIRGTVIKPTAEALKSNYAKFFVKEEKDRYGWTAHVFEIVNADIGKKMRLTVSNSASHQVTLEIINL
ncbi:hypothetical protein Ddc_19911 [Ditylenchus destructor]|nr:hypothetical protein Ddc_19911 [Ditylenchus destructor]